MWPFTSGDKNSSDVTSELSDNVKEFFEQNNPDKTHQSIFELTPHQKRVNEVLLRQEKKSEKQPFDYEFDRYKQMETDNKVIHVNCAELQQKVVDCLRSWKLTSTDQCRKEIGITTQCADIQKATLQKLFYADCYNVKQCEYIRYVADKLFTENFGQFGEDINDESKLKFDKEVEKAFYKAWK